jgi:anti-sigma regulatory factor (Ser/Thr protein kinase)
MAGAFPGYVAAEAGASAVAEGRRAVVEAPVGARWFRITDEPVVAGNAGAGAVRVVSEITDAREAARRHRSFVREVLASVTEGRLRLCDGEEDLPAPLLGAEGKRVVVSRESLHVLRDVLRAGARSAGLPEGLMIDILTAANEAAMNAVVHAGAGEAQVYAPPGSGKVQVWVRDEGRGIADEDLHRATLERGYSGKGGFGHGFWLMLNMCDRLFLLTRPQGTTLVLEQEIGVARTGWPRPESETYPATPGKPSDP